FNPITQQKRFDKDLIYVRRWLTEFDELTYPQPIVEHKFARERALSTYKETLASFV
ncbi:MAG: deoxyribodipyrimidine photo-lyase, partial [Limisphaerales bacterium]